MAARKLLVDRRSCCSVLVDLYQGAPPSIGLGSGFLVTDGPDAVLVTNYHVLSGRNQETDTPLDAHARLPNRVLIPVPYAAPRGVVDEGGIGWSCVVRELDDEEGNRLWVTHPTRGRAVDIAVLPLGTSESFCLDVSNTYSLDPGPELLVSVGSDISIVGFPEKIATPALTAIWKSGHVASEPELDVDDLPYFWVDAAGAPGMSGSPVVARRTGTFQFSDGSFQAGPGIKDRLLGLYSGRALADTSVGRCWKWSAVAETVRHALDAVRAGRITPRVGQLGVYTMPDDVRIPRVNDEGRHLTLLAQQLASAVGYRLSEMQMMANLRAALANPDEPRSIVLRPTHASVLKQVLEKLPQDDRVVALSSAVSAALGA